ncbi:MAG: hypothetical protein VYA84_16345 [Planctomycetota bacterium]|nr:hypothetical protein [Planctomycetota bacterium]
MGGQFFGGSERSRSELFSAIDRIRGQSTNLYELQDDVSGLPKSAAGSSIRSRDMIKWGMLIQNAGKWDGEQLVPAAFVKKTTS